MMRSKAAFLLSLAVIMLAAAMLLTLMPETDADDPAPDYSYADIIITATEDGKVQVSNKVIDEETGLVDWSVETYPSGGNLTLRILSEIRGGLTIVYDGPAVNKLIILKADTRPSLNTACDLDFQMYSGSIRTLSLLDVPKKILQYLSTSYDSMVTPFHNVRLDLYGGEIVQLNPTSCMVSVTNYDLNLYENMTVHRLYTTGENGKYSNVKVTVKGATIGYMTNIASKIGTLSYDMDYGHIDYFCIGANSQHKVTRDYTKLATSYVSGDVTVHLGSSTDIKKCIMGAGILNMPRILCNGESRNDPITHMVILDAPSVTISNDTTFLIDRRTYAYDLTGYTIGENMYAYALMDTIKIKEKSVKIYGETGFWGSTSSCSIPVGGILSCNTGFTQQSDGTFKVEKGATVFNSKDFILCGALIIEGNFVNNSVIQCRLGSTIEGDIKGIGFEADYISYVPTSSLSVVSSNTAVVIDSQEECAIESIFAQLSDDRRSVSITVEGSQRIYVDKFTISLHEIAAPEDFDSAFKLDIIGIDSNTLGISTVKVSLPTDSTMSTIVYGFNTQTNEYEAIGTSQYDPDVLFVAGQYNQFYLQKYIDEASDPNPPVEEKESTKVSNMDYFLIAAIIAVLCVTVYALITMKRQ